MCSLNQLLYLPFAKGIGGLYRSGPVFPFGFLVFISRTVVCELAIITYSNNVLLGWE